jgi:hypothetical protein
MMLALRHPLHLLALFVLLSGADLLLTGYLLRDPAADAYEANWLAAHVLGEYGFGGLVVYKGLLVALAGAVIWLVGSRHLPAARCLGAFACAATGLVVLYSLALAGLAPKHPPTQVRELATLEREQQSLERRFELRKAFSAVLERWQTDLAAGRCTLREALATLSAWDEARRLARLVECWCPGSRASDDEYLAAMVVRGTLCLLKLEGSAPAQGRAERLLAGYLKHYGTALADFVRMDLTPADPYAPDSRREAVALRADPRPAAAPAQKAARLWPRFGGRPSGHAWAARFAFRGPWHRVPWAYRRA